MSRLQHSLADGTASPHPSVGHNAPTTTPRGATSPPAKIILQGLVRLIEGQQRFADEFGLSYVRVFHDGFDAFRGRSVEEVLREWVQDGPRGAVRLQRLMEDLGGHQLALFGALDGIATETLEQLSPATIRRKSMRLFWFRPFAWLAYLKQHRRYAASAFARHQDLVVKGFVRVYTRLRELRVQPSTPPPPPKAHVKGGSRSS